MSNIVPIDDQYIELIDNGEDDVAEVLRYLELTDRKIQDGNTFRYLTLDEICQELGISRTTYYRRIGEWKKQDLLEKVRSVYFKIKMEVIATEIQRTLQTESEAIAAIRGIYMDKNVNPATRLNAWRTMHELYLKDAMNKDTSTGFEEQEFLRRRQQSKILNVG